MMKVNEIKKILKANKNVSDYEISYGKKESSELFFVLKKLELNRAISTETISIRVYVDVKDKRGSSSFTVTSGDDAKSLNKKINEAVKKAKTALNLYYPLASNQKKIDKKIKVKEDLNTIGLNVADAIFKADKYKEGWINSTEIFVSKNTHEFYNSKGVSHSDQKLSIEFEIIPTWTNGKEEFELYDYYKSNKFDAKAITSEVSNMLRLAKLRSEAKKLDEVKLKKNIPVLIYGEMNEVLVRRLISTFSYEYKYMHMNHYELKDAISNSKLNLTLKANIDGCAESKYYDENGVALSSKNIIKDGKLMSNFGGIRFAHYLNKKATGNYDVCEISGETANYKNKPHIIIEYFSSPQFDSTIGYFGGEVRLASYFDGKKYIPLTSFTVSGNIYEALKNIKFTKEKTTASNYKGPKYFIFEGLEIH